MYTFSLFCKPTTTLPDYVVPFLIIATLPSNIGREQE
jgi:hypothetical protein